MKKTLFLLLFSLQLFAQDLNYLKSQDTIYIILKEIEGNTTNKFDDFTFNCFGNDKFNEYNFVNKKGRPIVIQTMNRPSNPPINYINNNIRVNRKRFFKQNKDRIINFEFIRKMVPETLFIYYLDVINQRKTFYLFNEDDLNKRKIYLKKASVIAVGYTEM